MRQSFAWNEGRLVSRPICRHHGNRRFLCERKETGFVRYHIQPKTGRTAETFGVRFRLIRQVRRSISSLRFQMVFLAVDFQPALPARK